MATNFSREGDYGTDDPGAVFLLACAHVQAENGDWLAVNHSVDAYAQSCTCVRGTDLVRFWGPHYSEVE